MLFWQRAIRFHVYQQYALPNLLGRQNTFVQNPYIGHKPLAYRLSIGDMSTLAYQGQQTIFDRTQALCKAISYRHQWVRLF
jgi:hypothetical protein